MARVLSSNLPLCPDPAPMQVPGETPNLPSPASAVSVGFGAIASVAQRRSALLARFGTAPEGDDLEAAAPTPEPAPLPRP